MTMMMHHREKGLNDADALQDSCNASAVVRLAAGRVHGLVEKGVPRVRKAEGMCVRGQGLSWRTSVVPHGFSAMPLFIVRLPIASLPHAYAHMRSLALAR